MECACAVSESPILSYKGSFREKKPSHGNWSTPSPRERKKSIAEARKRATRGGDGRTIEREGRGGEETEGTNTSVSMSTTASTASSSTTTSTSVPVGFARRIARALEGSIDG